MHDPLAALASSILLAALALPAQAGSAELTCPDLNALSDAGTTQYDREKNIAQLGSYLNGLAGNGLGSDDKLKVELLELDLAGTMRIGSGGRETRVVRGLADWPRISVRYTLLHGSEVLSKGEDLLSDPNFTATMRSYGGDADRPLYYEKRMLADWFRSRFGSPQAATSVK